MSETMTRRQRQRERRLALWGRWHEGYSLRECVVWTAEQYHCCERTCYKDWAERHRWLVQEAALGSLDAFFVEQIASLHTVVQQTRRLLRLCRETGTIAYQLGCLNLLHRLHRDLLQYGRGAVAYLQRGEAVPVAAVTALLEAFTPSRPTRPLARSEGEGR
jgi:hypothetical protein